MTSTPTIYFDVTVTLRNGLNTGIQRVVKEVSRALTSAETKSHLIRVVSFDYETREGFVEVHSNFAEKLTITPSIQTKKAIRMRKILSNFRSVIQLFNTFSVFQRFKLLIMGKIYKQILSDLRTTNKESFKINEHDIYVTADCFWTSDDDTSRIKNAKDKGARICVYIHDLIPLSHPELFERSSVDLFKKNIMKVMNLQPVLICGSDFVLEEIKRNFPEIENVKKMELASRASFKLDEITNGVDTPGNILMIGTIEPRKNYLFVLKWMEVYGAHEKLVIIGRKGWKSKQTLKKIREMQRKGFNIQWIENASDARVQQEMQGAKLGICASIVEGYGLPLREFLQRGIPVVSSDIPAFHEGVNSDLDLQYFELDSLQSLNSAIQKSHTFRDRILFEPRTWENFTQELVSFVCQVD